MGCIVAPETADTMGAVVDENGAADDTDAADNPAYEAVAGEYAAGGIICDVVDGEYAAGNGYPVYGIGDVYPGKGYP